MRRDAQRTRQRTNYNHKTIPWMRSGRTSTIFFPNGSQSQLEMNVDERLARGNAADAERRG